MNTLYQYSDDCSRILAAQKWVKDAIEFKLKLERVQISVHF